MPAPSHHALLYRPGIRPDAQHLQIVIRFEDQHIGAPKMHAQRIWNVAQVGGKGKLNALRTNRVADRIGRIVRNSKTLDVEIANREAAACLKGFDNWMALSPFQARGSAVRKIHGQAAVRALDQRRQPTGVVAMLVSNQHGVQLRKIFPNRGQTPREFPPADPGIDENARPVRRDESGVAGTARSENADF